MSKIQVDSIADRAGNNLIPVSELNKAEFVEFVQAGVDAVVRSVHDELQDRVTVTQFGADRTGIVDAYPAFLKAYTYITSLGGGTIEVPAGKYRLNTTFAVLVGGINIKGGPGVDIINGVADGPAIQIGNGSSLIFSSNVSGLNFSCALGIIGTTNNRGLLATKVAQSTFYDIKTSQFPAKLSNGVKFDGCVQCYLDGMVVQDTGGVGVDIYRCNDLYGHTMRSDANGVGWRIEDTNGIFFTAATAYFNTIFAWDLKSDGVLNNNLNHFYTSCVGDFSGNTNWNITQLSESSLVGCWGSTQQSTTVNTFAPGFFLNGVVVRSIKFVGCQALYNNQHGFHIEQGSNIELIGSSAGTPAHGNGRAGFGNGIYFGPGANNCTVVAGTAVENHDYGISADTSATNIIFNNIRLSANGVGSVQPNTFGGTRVGRDVIGYSPLSGAIATPTLPASATTVTNTTGFDCQVAIFTGAVSAIYIDGAYSFNATDVTFIVKANATIRVDYTVAPLWKWIGL